MRLNFLSPTPYYFTNWYTDKKWGKRGFAVWASNTCGKGVPGEAYAELQSDLDGNFVIYTEPRRKNAIWASGVYGEQYKGDSIALQAEGWPPSPKIVIYPKGVKPSNDYKDSIWRAPQY